MTLQAITIMTLMEFGSTLQAKSILLRMIRLTEMLIASSVHIIGMSNNLINIFGGNGTGNSQFNRLLSAVVDNTGRYLHLGSEQQLYKEVQLRRFL